MLAHPFPLWGWQGRRGQRTARGHSSVELVPSPPLHRFWIVFRLQACEANCLYQLFISPALIFFSELTIESRA